jgi:hypothetical protein
MSAKATLYELVTGLIATLFEREEASLTRRIENVATRNSALGGSIDGCRHAGVVFTSLKGKKRSMGSYSRIHPTLVEEANLILEDQKILASEKAKIQQAFAIVLRDARSLQDIRDALPNAVRDIAPELSHLERTRPEAYTLADNPRSYTQYMKLRDKIEYHVASRMLF